MPFWQISWLFFLKIEKMLAECQNVKYNISKGQIVKQIKRNRVLLCRKYLMLYLCLNI